MDRDDNTWSLLATADDLCGMAGTKSHVPREVEASGGFEDTRLSCALIANHNHLGKRNHIRDAKLSKLVHLIEKGSAGETLARFVSLGRHLCNWSFDNWL
jgi:hypothetical protein